MEKKAVPVRTTALVAPSPQTPTSEELKKIRKLLSNSREENADLVEQVQTQEKELYEARQELEFVKAENERLQEKLLKALAMPLLTEGGTSADMSLTEKESPPPLSPMHFDAEDPEEQVPLDPEWEFCKEFFQEVTVNTKEIYRYEATLRQVARKLWPELKNKDNMLY